MTAVPLPLRHALYDMIRGAKSLTDAELSKLLVKKDMVLPADVVDKALLDMEITGLVRVTWLTKDARRIEALEQGAGPDDVDRLAAEGESLDYEASFPGA